jgi:hypothetical protein
MASAPIPAISCRALAMRTSRSSLVIAGAGFGQGARPASSASAVDPPMLMGLSPLASTYDRK